MPVAGQHQRRFAMTDEKGIKKVGVYEYEPKCTVDYDRLYCDGDCLRCDEVAAERAAEAAEARQDESRLWGQS